MKLFQKTGALIYLMLIGIVTYAQHSYPLNYFTNPLSIPIFLAGNFGECRPNHFHSGIDIKTLGKENLPVHAAASGYVSRIKLDAVGFGHAIYITHPNGFTTLYAHLNDFEPALQKFVRQQQYAQKKWNIDVTLNSDQFPVRQGQFIAYSGNTGSSTAPHLHFEIRNTLSEHPLNPMLFGLPIADTLAPIPIRIGTYDRSKSNYDPSRKVYDLQKSGNAYLVKDIMYVNSSNPGWGIEINDYMQGSTNTLTYYTCKVYIDQQLIQTITLDDIGYDVTRYMHAFVDYPLYKNSSSWVQLLFRLPGNALTHLYTHPDQQFNWLPKEHHALKIECIDALSNSTTIMGTIVVAAIDTVKNNYNLFPSKAYTFEEDAVAITIPENSVYDNAPFNPIIKSGTLLSPQVITNQLAIPLHKAMRIAIRPYREVPVHLQNKVVMQCVNQQDTVYKAAVLDDERFVSTTKELASFQLLIDTTAPTITLMTPAKQGKISNELRFQVRDAYTSIASFQCRIDHQWVCFEQRSKEWFYKMDAHCKPGKHSLEAVAIDENGNKKEVQFNFISK
jgi:hypothetical protein